MSVQLAQTQQVDLLYNKIMAELKQMHETAKPKQRGTFAEPTGDESHDGFGMPSMGGLLTVKSGNLLVMAFGAALSGVVGGLITRFLPTNFGLAGLPQIIAGIILKKFLGKGQGTIVDFANGVLIAGVALLVGGFTGGIIGGTSGATMFGERKIAFREATYGTTPDGYVRGTGYGNNLYVNRPVVR